MNRVTSADGTSIAFERLGDGPPLIVVGGATCDRGRMREVSERLARRFAVINYDRRGRGGTVPTELAARVEAPALVLVGGAGPPWMVEVGGEVAGAMQNGELRVLEGQEHVVPPD